MTFNLWTSKVRPLPVGRLVDLLQLLQMCHLLCLNIVTMRNLKGCAYVQWHRDVLVVGTCRASLHIFYVNSLVLWTISWCFSRCVGCHVWIIFAQYTSNSSRITANKSFIKTFASHFIPLNSIAQKGYTSRWSESPFLGRIEVVVQIVFLTFFGGFPAKRNLQLTCTYLKIKGPCLGSLVSQQEPHASSGARIRAAFLRERKTECSRQQVLNHLQCL